MTKSSTPRTLDDRATITSFPAAPNRSSKSFHRWTQEEDRKLLSVLADLDSTFRTVGTPGGISGELFWSQIPGRVGIMVTSMACRMRYRTLTGSTRHPADPKPSEPIRPSAVPPERIEALVEEMTTTLAEFKEITARLLDVWTAPVHTGHGPKS